MHPNELFNSTDYIIVRFFFQRDKRKPSVDYEKIDLSISICRLEKYLKKDFRIDIDLLVSNETLDFQYCVGGYYQHHQSLYRANVYVLGVNVFFLSSSF